MELKRTFNPDSLQSARLVFRSKKRLQSCLDANLLGCIRNAQDIINQLNTVQFIQTYDLFVTIYNL